MLFVCLFVFFLGNEVDHLSYFHKSWCRSGMVDRDVDHIESSD